MTENVHKPKAEKKTKIEKLEQLYGKNDANATLEEASEFLKSKGFKPLADFLVPAK